MKKLMVMAAVAMAAFGLRAATADWTFDTYMDDQFGTGVADGSLAFYCGDVLMDTITSDGGGGFTGDFTDVASGSSWKVVMSAGLTDDGENFTQFTKEYAFTMPTFVGGGDPADASALAGINTDIQNAFSPADVGALPTASEAAAAGWTAAPEPTSGLLLLIGVAGLALRRRRA